MLEWTRSIFWPGIMMRWHVGHRVGLILLCLVCSEIRGDLQWVKSGMATDCAETLLHCLLVAVLLFFSARAPICAESAIWHLLSKTLLFLDLQHYLFLGTVYSAAIAWVQRSVLSSILVSEYVKLNVNGNKTVYICHAFFSNELNIKQTNISRNATGNRMTNVVKSEVIRILSKTDKHIQIQTKNWWVFIEWLITPDLELGSEFWNRIRYPFWLKKPVLFTKSWSVWCICVVSRLLP